MRKRTLDRLERELGELLSSHEGEVDLERFEPYRRDPVGFSRDVLGDDPGPWADQVEVMEAVRDHDRVVWRSGQGVGKGWTIARVALWWAYSVGGLVLISAPTSRTVHEATMRKELARAFRRAGLPGELYVNALRIREEEPAILAYTTSQASGGTGHHDRRVLAILDEAQGCDSEAWEAMYANIVGEEDTLLATGNPLAPYGDFFQVSQPGSGWYAVQTSCLDHPNLQGGHPRHVPGGPSEGWLERMSDRWGKGSAMWMARVEGQFPRDSVEGLYSLDAIEAAMARWNDGAFRSVHTDEPPVVALDVARHGMDQSVAAITRGRHVEKLVAWSGASTTETVAKVEELAKRAGVLPKLPDGPQLEDGSIVRGEETPRGELVVDEIGVGAGVTDRLKERGWPTYGFKASKRANDRKRFRDAKAEAYWRLRELLEEGEVSLPDDDLLREELLTARWSPDRKGKVAVESKDELQSRLGGRSPDRLDALVMAFAESGRRRPRVTRSVTW